MSIKTAIRAKFRRTESSETFSDADSPSDKKKEKERKLTADSRGDSFYEGIGTLIEVPDTDDKDELRLFYESFIKELQSQLLSSTIENENLSESLKSIREKHRVNDLERELETEKQRYDRLLEKFKEMSDTSNISALRGMKIRRPNELDVSKGACPEAFEEMQHRNPDEVEILMATPPIARHWVYVLWSSMLEFIHDIQHGEESPPDESEAEDEPLSPKRLKENITRLGRAMTPIWETIAGVRAIASWRWPSYTCLVFMLYMYSLWSGWVLPALLSVILLRMVLNYLKFRRGWAIDLHFIRMYEPEVPRNIRQTKRLNDQKSQDTGVAVQFNFIVHVARKCQNMSGVIADNLEKLKNLLTWQCPDITAKVTQIIMIALILSLLLSVDRLFFLLGIYLGIKLFIIDCFFMRFPRIRRKYDSVYNAWQRLPTDAQLNLYSSSTMEKYILPANDSSPDLPSSNSFDASNVSPDDKTFCEIFSLPVTECPLPSWKTGKRCAILNRDKSLANAFKHGKLYLTRSFLCFERGKEKERRSKKHICIPLSQIKSIEKVKPFSWLPGSGMTISISITGFAKPIMFGVLMNRDDIYDGLMKAGRAAKMQWSDGMDGSAIEVEVDPILVDALNTALLDDSDSE